MMVGTYDNKESHVDEELLFVAPSEIYLEAFEALAEACKDLPEVYRPNLPANTTMIQLLNDHEVGAGLPDGYVPASHRWLVRKSDGKIVGVVNIRHGLNAFLSFRGGHIGYYVPSCERRRGYATRLLDMALKHCIEIGLKTVLITCDDANIGSYKTIESNNGILISKEVDSEGVVFRRYEIALETR